MTRRFIDGVPSRLTQEQKDLLLDDLCARLPFNVRMYDIDVTLPKIDLWLRGLTYEGSVMVGDDGRGLECSSVGAYLPYLFPLSSMTKEQKNRFPFPYSFLEALIDGGGYFAEDECITLNDMIDVVQWCYKHHFDINGLIPMGLAIDATGKNIY